MTDGDMSRVRRGEQGLTLLAGEQRGRVSSGRG